MVKSELPKIELSLSYISSLPQIGEGACARVYQYGQNTALKVYKPQGMKMNDEEFFKLVGIKNGSCVFPQCLLEIDGEFAGYAMELVHGELLHHVVEKLDLVSLINAIKKVEVDIDALSKAHIVFSDVNHGGLMWTDDGKIKIIDTDFFFVNEKASEGECLGQNLESFYSMIEMVTKFMDGPIQAYLNSQEEYSDLFKDYTIACWSKRNMISVTELYEKAITIFKEKFGKEPKSIKEMEDILRENNLFNEVDEDREVPTFEPPTEPTEASAITLDGFISGNKGEIDP